MAEERTLDVVIFGASGFTGKYTVFEGVKLLAGLKWGVAGRNKEKLERMLKEIGDKAKTDLSKTPILIADVDDEASLKKMAEQCRIVVNACGPYRFWGEAVVKACIEAGTNHVDVSGEPQYMERMQLEYHDLAKAKGVYVISACGFDSIPADLGVVFLQNHFEGTVNSVETYLESWSTGGKVPGAEIHYGTWHSAVYGLAHADELKGLRSKLFKSRLPALKPKLADKFPVHKTKVTRSPWCLPFPGSDRSVVMRSQRYFFENWKQRPIQMKAYVTFPQFLHAFVTILVAVVFGTMARFSFGRKLLLNHPKLFSLGMVSHEGPTEESMERNRFAMHFIGEGWTEKLAEPTDEYSTPPNKRIHTKVSGANVGYGSTCRALLLAATTILKDKPKMADNGAGGVFPPGAAFARTSLISELCKNGVMFEVVSSKERETEKSEEKVEEAAKKTGEAVKETVEAVKETVEVVKEAAEAAE